MVKVKYGSQKISHHSGNRKSVRDGYELTLVYNAVDVKTFLQEYLKELRLYGMPNRFTEKELIELFATRVFSAVPYKTAIEMGEWAFDVGIRRSYFSSNRWDRNEPTIYFIDRTQMSIKRGRKPKREVETYDEEN